VSSKSVRAYDAQRAAYGRHVRPVDVNGSWRRSLASSAPPRPLEAVPDPTSALVPFNGRAPTAPRRGAGERARGAATKLKLIVLRREELAELIRDAITDAMALAAAEPPPALLDRNGLARMLGIGIGTVDRLRRDGCPAAWSGPTKPSGRYRSRNSEV
jgi:hypothetical protein